MADYTLDDIDGLLKKGLITPQERDLLRNDLVQQANQSEGYARKFVGHLNQEVSEAWGRIKAGAKNDKAKDDGFMAAAMGNVDIIVGGLQLLSAIPTAAGKTNGEGLARLLVKMGASEDVARIAGTVSEITTSIGVPSIPGLGIASKVIKGGKAQSQVKKGLETWVKKQAGIEVEKTAAKTAAEKIAEKSAATASQIDDAAKVLNKVDDAAESGAGKIDEAYEALIGPWSAEDVAAQIGSKPEVKAAVRKLNKWGDVIGEDGRVLEVNVTGAKGATITPRGGAPLGGLDVSQTLLPTRRAQRSFQAGADAYEGARIKLADLQKVAQEKQMSIADVMKLKPGDAITPQGVADISVPIKFYGEAFIQNVKDARPAMEKGDLSKFWEAMTHFNILTEAHWPYMFPRQVAGQTLKTYDEPVLSATRFLQQMPALGSWMAKLKISNIDELEASAPLILKEMEKLSSPSQIANFAKKTAETMAEGGEAVLNDPTFRDKARFFFVNSLMSGTDTIGRNLAGNTVAVPYHYAEKLTSSVASKVLNPFLKPEHRLAATPMSDATAGMGIWFKTMYDSSKYLLTNKYDRIHGLIPDESALTNLLSNRYDLKTFATSGTTNPFGGTLGKVIGTPVTIAQTADEISRIAAYRMAVGELAHNQWRTSGSKVPWRSFFDDFMGNVPPSAHEYGVRIAHEMTYSDSMSKMGKVASMARESLPGTEFLAPFIRTVDRLTAFGYNRSPVLSLLSTRLKDELTSGDAAVRAEAVGRVTLASIMGAGTFAAARTVAPDGMAMITGGGPTDRTLASRLRDSKIHVPYTIWTPAGRFSYASLQPARAPLGLVADASEIWDEIKQPDAESLWQGILLAGTRNFFDQTYTKSFADIFSIWDNPERGSSSALSRITANVIKGFVEPSIVRQMMREADPTAKESHDFLDELTREIPGYGGPARRNPLTGEKIMNPPRLLADTPVLGWFLPSSPIQPASDAFANKIKELGLKVPEFPHAYGGHDPSESAFAYSGALGESKEAKAGIPLGRLRQRGIELMHSPEGFDKTLNDEANEMVSDPDFNTLSAPDQAEAINSIYNSRISAAMGRLVEENPELLQAYEQKVQTRAEVRMPPAERQAYEQTTIAPPAEPIASAEEVAPFPDMGATE